MDKITACSCPVEYDESSFSDLLSLAAGRALLCQNRLGAKIIGDRPWAINPTEGLIRFGDSEFHAEILGTESEITNTWLWSRAHTESGLPERITAVSRKAKKLLPKLPEFQEGKFMLDGLHNGHNLAMATVGALPENVCYYRCPYDGGAVFAVIYGLPDEIFAPAAEGEFMRQYMDIVGGLYCDHRLLAAGFLHQNGTPFTLDGSTITADFTGKKLRMTFENTDGINRITDITAV